VIAFLSLFLGLVHGSLTVELSAGPEVARVELVLDGQKAAEVGPPWTATLDLGPEIVPRELVAVAFSREGKRLGEARQWLNRARPQAEAGFVLERDRSGRVTHARLHWRCLSSPEPLSVSVSFDGSALAVKDHSRIPIPPHAAEVSHLLLADLTFAGGIAATAVTSFGGRQRDEAERELTAFPVRVTGKAEPPNADRLTGWFEAAGQAVPVAAVEKGPGEVLFVLAGRARQDFDRLRTEDSWPWPWPRPRPLDLPSGTRYRFVSTSPNVLDRPQWTFRLFSSTEEFVASSTAFLRVASRAFLPESLAPPCVAESVAVSALAATALERRRAAVLVLGEGADDEGSLDAARVRRYLARIRVPLHVWRLSGGQVPAAGDWPEASDASTIDGMGRAFEALRSDLSTQRIVWLEGRLPPSAVSLTGKAKGLVEAR
jgi:hypothetical protein